MDSLVPDPANPTVPHRVDDNVLTTLPLDVVRLIVPYLTSYSAICTFAELYPQLVSTDSPESMNMWNKMATEWGWQSNPSPSCVSTVPSIPSYGIVPAPYAGTVWPIMVPRANENQSSSISPPSSPPTESTEREGDDSSSSSEGSDTSPNPKLSYFDSGSTLEHNLSPSYITNPSLTPFHYILAQSERWGRIVSLERLCANVLGKRSRPPTNKRSKVSLRPMAPLLHDWKRSMPSGPYTSRDGILADWGCGRIVSPNRPYRHQRATDTTPIAKDQGTWAPISDRTLVTVHRHQSTNEEVCVHWRPTYVDGSNKSATTVATPMLTPGPEDEPGNQYRVLLATHMISNTTTYIEHMVYLLERKKADGTIERAVGLRYNPDEPVLWGVGNEWNEVIGLYHYTRSNNTYFMAITEDAAFAPAPRFPVPTTDAWKHPYAERPGPTALAVPQRRVWRRRPDDNDDGVLLAHVHSAPKPPQPDEDDDIGPPMVPGAISTILYTRAIRLSLLASGDVIATTTGGPASGTTIITIPGAIDLAITGQCVVACVQ